MQELLRYLSVDAMVILISMVPLVEARGAIPIGVAMGLTPFWSLVIAILGSTIPVPFILLGIRPFFSWLKSKKLFRNFINKISVSAIRKSDNIVKYGFWGLILFVGIPLPGTGVWTGSLIAALLNMRIKVAFPAIFIGNLIAGIIMYALSHTTINFFGL